MSDELNNMVDRESLLNIEKITDCIVSQVKPQKIFLFGSFAKGSYNKDSDYDFYIVVGDKDDPSESRKKARKAIRDVQNRPVDIVVGTSSRFQKYGMTDDTLYVEREVARTGKLLYDRDLI